MDDSDRFARHALVPGWRQPALASAHVVVIGLGALGNEVSRVLAMSGVGEMTLCDPDRIEASNLSRCALFRSADIGRYKVDAAADALRALAPELHATARAQPLVRGVGLGELATAQLVLSCLDSRAARLQLAGRCNLVGAPMIDGGTQPWGGEVRPFLAADGPCYGCGLGDAARGSADAPWSCLDQRMPVPQGATAAASVLVGGWMALLALRHLMGQSDLASRLLQIDGAQATMGTVQVERDPDCPLHLPMGPVRRLPVGANGSVGDLRACLPAGAVPLVWEPVQDALECPHCGHSKTRWGLPQQQTCPACGQQMPPRTTLELDCAPADIHLAALGLPPKERLAVRTDAGITWVELAGG